jgi:hypothetical protein
MTRQRITLTMFPPTRVACGATGRIIRDGLALFVSAMDNSLCFDRAVEGEVWDRSPLPTDGECEAAYEGLRRGREIAAVTT